MERTDSLLSKDASDSAALYGLVRGLPSDLVHETLRTLFQASPLATLVTDRSGRILVWNRAAEEILGWPAHEVLGLPPPFIPKGRRAAACAYHQMMFRGDVFRGTEARLLRPDGQLIDITFWSSPLRDACGEISASAIQVVDITARKRGDRTLRLLQALLLEIGDSADIDAALTVVLERLCEAMGWILGEAWLLSADGAVLEHSTAWCARGNAYSGYRAWSENLRFPMGVGLPGMVWSCRKPMTIQDVTVDPLFVRAQIARQARLGASTAIPVLADGDVMAVLQFYTEAGVCLDEESVFIAGAVAAQMGSLMRRKRAEAALRRSEERGRHLGRELERLLAKERSARLEAESANRLLTLLAEASKVLGSSFDYHVSLQNLACLAVPDFADVCVVDIFEELEGERKLRRVALSHADPELLPLVERLRSDVIDESSDSILSEALRTGMARVVSEAEKTFFSSTEGDPPSASSPSFAMVVPLVSRERSIGAITFISFRRERYGAPELKVAQELAARAALAMENALLYQRAEQAICAREDLLAIVSHDLKNPLMAIRLYAGLAQASLYDLELTRERIVKIDVVTRQMEHLVHNLLDLASAETGNLELSLHPEAADDLIEEALATMQPIAFERSIRLDKGLVAPGLETLCDRQRIGQVLLNLVGNAIKFSPLGSTVTIRAEAFGDEIRFAVCDVGPGIPQAQLSRVFDRYWRGGKKGGTGLGLAIAKSVVEAHGGWIWVESQLGVGSNFYFSLPRCNAA